MTKNQRILSITILIACFLILLTFIGRDLFLRHGRVIECEDGLRETIDLRDFATRYSAYSLSFEAKAGTDFTLSGKLDPIQLTALSEAGQQAAEFRKVLIAGFNSCAVSKVQFAAASSRFQALDGLSRQITQLAGKPDISAADQKHIATLVSEYIKQAARLGDLEP